ncbi:MAG: hypothetical protein H0T89_25875 [Deltaproteobacteria bacterium]|nr:hypothetical protein [Deltaproteobacteria bacterium]MDQ3301212.1 hypothetical protein [Myxococcota bacterium]
MPARPQFKTYEQWFAWVLAKLRHGSWSSKSTNFYVWEFFVNGYGRFDKAMGRNTAKRPLVTFLSSQVDALRGAGDERTIERLRVHVLACREIMNHQVRRETADFLKNLEGPRTQPPERYVFKRERVYEEAAISRLPRDDRKQFLVAASKYLGGNFRTVPAFFKKLRRDPDEADTSIERWKITAKRAPVYEMWTFLVDNGTVFPIGGTVPVAQMVQGTFQVEPGQANPTLASDLQRTVPF